MSHTDRINYLNAGLMLAACGLALAIPFELFLLAYAVLGPLHYVTEISWLHQRRYFAKGGHGYLALALVVCLAMIVVDALPVAGATERALSTTLVAGVFFAALAVATVESARARALVVLAGFLVASLLSGLRDLQLLFLMFVPTVVHVFLFTAAFVLLGSLRGGGRSGGLSLAVLVLCAVSTFVAPVANEVPPPSGYVQDAFGAFASLNVALSRLVSEAPISGDLDLFSSPEGVRIQRFVAFAYTYHYLNWFSKTSIIQWHRIPRGWTFANLAVWLVSVGVYAWDYRTGLALLLWLSFAHVVLEFPLNQKTFLAIGAELRGRVRRGPGPHPAGLAERP